MRLRRNDSGTTEVIGFVLSFALSAVFLLISLNAFHAARNNTDAMVSGVELKTIADRVASDVLEVSVIGQEFRNASVSLSTRVPATINGHSYTVYASTDKVKVTADDGTASAESTTFKLEAIPNIQVSGTVRSANEVVVVKYRLEDQGTADPTDDMHTITIHEAT